MRIESMVHTDEINELPWSISPDDEAVILDLHGEPIASFVVRHVEKGVLGNCDKNADLAVRAVNAYGREKSADIHQLQDWICEWADQQFPNRTTANVLFKLYEEIGEYARDPSSELEFADIMILLLDVARANKINIRKAIETKMTINEGRAWKVDLVTGIMRHV